VARAGFERRPLVVDRPARTWLRNGSTWLRRHRTGIRFDDCPL